MKDTVFITFDRNKAGKMLKTKPEGGHYIKLNIIVDPAYFIKNEITGTIKINENANLSIEEFEVELKRIKSIK